MKGPGLNSRILSKNDKPGAAPAIILWNPKHSHNVGGALRAASCYGLRQVWYTGDRVNAELSKRKRMPREERMKGYMDVDLINSDYPFDAFPNGSPIAVEISPTAEVLCDFVWPENPIFVFGPEDGSIPGVARQHCHRHVVIPTFHCLNLAVAVGTVLYDWKSKRWAAGLEERKSADRILKEQRGFVCDMENEDAL